MSTSMAMTTTTIPQESEQSFEIHIRSRDCAQQQTGFNTHFVVSLEAPIHRPEGMEMHVSVSSAAIPWSWYSFSSHLGTEKLQVDGADTNGLTLTEGNYDIYEMVAAITADAAFNYTATFNVNTLKVTLTNSDATQYTINFSNAVSQGLARALGFDTSTDQTVAAGGSVTSDYTVNLQTIHSLFFHSNEISVANVITTERGNWETILDKIPLVNVAPAGVVHYDPYQTAPFQAVLDQNILKVFDISIRDQNGRLLQLNDREYEMTLLVEIKHPHRKPKKNIRPARRINRDAMDIGPPSIPLIHRNMDVDAVGGSGTKRRAVSTLEQNLDSVSVTLKPPIPHGGPNATDTAANTTAANTTTTTSDADANAMTIVSALLKPPIPVGGPGVQVSSNSNPNPAEESTEASGQAATQAPGAQTTLESPIPHGGPDVEEATEAVNDFLDEYLDLF